MTLATKALPKAIQTEFCQFPNRNGTKIVACIDHPPAGRGPRRFVVMSPKYGESKKNNLQLAYHLAANGLTVLRFDHTCHVGESEGDMKDFTMPGAVEDIIASLDFLERQHGVEKVTLVASSMSARCAFRAAAQDRRIAKLISLVGVVNVRYTLEQIYREDIVGTFMSGRKWGMTDILGFEINGETYLGETIRADMHDLSGTKKDIEKLTIPIVHFRAEKDSWVSAKDVEEVFGGRKNVRVRTLPGAMHEVRESRESAEEMIRQVIRACLGARRSSRTPSLVVPDRKAVFAQNRIERERLREAVREQESEREFWSSYLTRYDVLGQAEHYHEYLEVVGDLLGPFNRHDVVLDAGCGNGLFGVWLARQVLARSPAPVTPLVYLGIDLTEKGLTDSMNKHTGVTRTFANGKKTSDCVGFLYTPVDLDGMNGASGIRFADDCFSKICCSLLLSYLKDPARLLREMYRLLRPGGTIVVSTMKPYCDMSEVYRAFIAQQVTEDELESARGLLSAAGRIKVKEERGVYAFFSEPELESLLAKAGFRPLKTCRSLGDQANLIQATK